MKKFIDKIFNKKYSNIYVAIIVVAALGGMLLWRLKFSNPNSSLLANSLSSELTKDLGEAETYNSQETGTSTASGAGGDFTFLYPKKLNVTESPIEGITGGKRILAESTEAKKGFEVIVLPFDEVGLLSKDRILQDVPDMIIKNERETRVGGGIYALAFNSTDENIGDTFEIWFTHKGFIYEARTYPEFGPAMEEILNNWQFK